MARKRKHGPAKPVTFVNPAMREVVNPRTGQVHVLLLGKWRDSDQCQLAFFRRPNGLKVAVQRCRDRNLKDHKVCRAGDPDWREQIKKNFAAGMSVKQGAFSPARPVACPPTHARTRPPKLGPRLQHCYGYDVRVGGERVAIALDKDQAAALARRFAAERKGPVTVTTACRASELVGRVP
jgi:hypothetical protein